MGLFKSDLYRSLAFGFFAGTVALAAVMGFSAEDVSASLITPAVAATAQAE